MVVIPQLNALYRHMMVDMLLLVIHLNTKEGQNVYIIKLDSNGNLTWTKTIGGRSGEQGFHIIQTSDYGYAIAGITLTFSIYNSNYDPYIVKPDSFP